MLFIKNILCCLLMFLTIVMPINCNKFNSKINQSRYKRFPRQVNVNNNQQIGANDSVPSDRKNIFGTTLQSGFDALNQGVKDVMHHMSTGRLIFPGRADERRGRQLISNIYSQTHGNNYNNQDNYAANREYYDKYYDNYYRSYYQTAATTTTTESYIQYQNQITQPNQLQPQSLPNRLNGANISRSNQNDGERTLYIDENGMFQISSTNAKNTVNAVPSVIDDDAIVFQSDETQHTGRTRFFNNNDAKQPGLTNPSMKNYFNGLPIFAN